ncbi:MAG: ABC transporter permease [Planctomycetota bacterium]|jgi:ABC-2 type transport system permease protein
MSNMIVRVFRNELSKHWRTKLPYFGIVASGLVCLLAFAVMARQGDVGNGWGYVSMSMQMVFSDIGPLFVVVFAAMLIAEETGSGTVRVVLSCPVGRWEFYIAKVMTGLLYALIVSLSSLVISFCLGAVHYTFGEVSDSIGLIYGKKEVIRNILTALLLSWLPLAAVVLFGIFISTLIKKSGQAVAVAIGLISLLDLTKHLLGIESYVFTRYLVFSWGVFNQVAQGVDYQWFPGVWKMAGVSIAYIIVLFAAGLLVFSRRDFNG